MAASSERRGAGGCCKRPCAQDCARLLLPTNMQLPLPLAAAVLALLLLAAAGPRLAQACSPVLVGGFDMPFTSWATGSLANSSPPGSIIVTADMNSVGWSTAVCTHFACTCPDVPNSLMQAHASACCTLLSLHANHLPFAC